MINPRLQVHESISQSYSYSGHRHKAPMQCAIAMLLICGKTGPVML